MKINPGGRLTHQTKADMLREQRANEDNSTTTMSEAQKLPNPVKSTSLKDIVLAGQSLLLKLSELELECQRELYMDGNVAMLLSRIALITAHRTGKWSDLAARVMQEEKKQIELDFDDDSKYAEE